MTNDDTPTGPTGNPSGGTTLADMQTPPNQTPGIIDAIEQPDPAQPDRTTPPDGGPFARTTLMATNTAVATLAFGFTFGNVWDLCRLLHVERHIAPLIGPAVDLSVIGLLVAIQWLALAGATTLELRPARRLLAACGVVTMALNSTPSLITGITKDDPYALGRAGVEAIAPWLLIAWCHVGPQILRLFVQIRERFAVAQQREAAAVRAAKRAKGPPVRSAGPVDQTPARTKRTPAVAKRQTPKRTPDQTTKRSGHQTPPSGADRTPTGPDHQTPITGPDQTPMDGVRQTTSLSDAEVLAALAKLGDRTPSISEVQTIAGGGKARAIRLRDLAVAQITAADSAPVNGVDHHLALKEG